MSVDPFQGKIIPKQLKRTTRLTDEERQEIIELHKTGQHSMRKLGRDFGVSYRLIRFILNPEELIRAKQQFAERQAEGRYYDKDKHRVAMQRHRAYKRQLDQDNKLIEKK